jgi:hypothetical protein
LKKKSNWEQWLKDLGFSPTSSLLLFSRDTKDGTTTINALEAAQRDSFNELKEYVENLESEETRNSK